MGLRKALVVICMALLVCSAVLVLGPPGALAAPDTTSYFPMGGWPHVLQFGAPVGVAVDTSGNVFTADAQNDRILKIGPDGTFITQWGSLGTTTPGQFNEPFGVALDGSTNVHVVDWGNNRVQVFNSSGAFLREWGSLGTTTPGQFSAPEGIAIDRTGRVYVVDSGNNRIQRFSAMGDPQIQWGSYGTTAAGQFNDPGGIAVDGSGNVYVADHGNDRMQKFDGDGNFLTQWGSTGTTTPGTFDDPWGVAVDGSGNVWVCDSENGRIQKFSGTGTFLGMWGYPMEGFVLSGAPAGPYFRMPMGVAVDGSGNVYVSDTMDFRVEKFTPAGQLLANWAGMGPDDGRFAFPVDLATDNQGHVYVADSLNWRVQKFTTSGVWLDKWGSLGLGALGTDNAAQAPLRGAVEPQQAAPFKVPGFPFPGIFMLPTGVACDVSGNVYVSDGIINTVRWYSPDGAMISGFGSPGSGDGQFKDARSVAVDPNSGNVYVADAGNNRVQKFTRDGWYLGQWGSPGILPGQFIRPRGLAVDPAGWVYVADTENDRVQKFDLNGTFNMMWGSIGTAPGAFDSPRRIAIDPDHNVLVADANNNRIQKFDGNGTFITQFGSIGTTAGSIFNPPLDGSLSDPRGVACDASGTVYVADTFNHRVQVFSRDLEPPVTHATVVPVPSSPSRQFVIDSATDAVSGVDKTYYRLDGGATQTAAGLPTTMTVTTDGTHTLAYWSTDKAGHMETPKTLTAKVRGFWSVLMLRNSVATVPYNGAVVISGSLAASGTTNAAIPGRPVVLWKSIDSSKTWTKVATLTTDANGRFSVRKRLVRTTQWRADFAGDWDFPETISRRRTVRARAWLSKPAMPDPVTEESFVITGFLKPFHKQATLLYFYRRVGRKWKFAGTSRAINTNYRDFTRYYVRVKVGPAGSWYVRAYHADSSHAPTWSPRKYFTPVSAGL